MSDVHRPVQLRARRLLKPRTAVILDTETTGFDGAIIELAVIDAASADVVLHTLVDPGAAAIEPDAHAVHGITARELLGAPPWQQVLPALIDVTRGREILAYNATFDRERVLAMTHEAGCDPAHLADPTIWDCVMALRSAAVGTADRLPLNGGHRALADCRATRAVLREIAAGRASQHPLVRERALRSAA